jgi:hypothetical protein
VNAKQVTIAIRTLRNRKASLDAVWLALRAMLYPRLAYSATFVPYKEQELMEYDRQLAATIRRAARAVRTLPAAAYGQDVLRLSTHVRTAAKYQGAASQEEEWQKYLRRGSRRGPGWTHYSWKLARRHGGEPMEEG